MRRMLNALVLFQVRHASQNRPTILDHVQFLSHVPERVQVAYVNLPDDQGFDPRWRDFDLVILHGTLLERRALTARYAAGGGLSWLKEFRGTVVAMPTHEFEHPHALDDVLANAQAHIIVTQHSEASRALLYPRMHTRAYFLEALPAYLHPARVEKARREYRPWTTRDVDAMYRARELPFEYGRIGHQRSSLLQTLVPRLREAGYVTDVSLSSSDMLMGDSWLDLLGRSRVVLGTERGSSALDRRGELGAHIRALLAEESTLSFDAVDDAMEGELSRHHFASIAPRHLEAITTRTAQVLVEGHYSGVLQPWTHYVPLKEDFSNIPDVLRAIADTDQLQRMVDTAYADVVRCGGYTYATFASQLLDIVEVYRSLRAAA